MGQTTITVNESTLERFKQLKAELDAEQDAPDHTADSFLQGLLDTWEAAGDGYYSDPSAEEIAEQLKDELSMANEPGVEVDIAGLIDHIERLEETVKEATHAAQETQSQLEELQG
jgi:hypothetical protein